MIVHACKLEVGCQRACGRDLTERIIQKLRDDVTAGVGQPSNRSKMIEDVKVIVARYGLTHCEELLSQCSRSVAFFSPLITAPNKLLGTRD